MGIDYNAYVGPYIVIKPAKKPTVTKERLLRVCANGHKVQQSSIYCSSCGTKAIDMVEKYESEVDFYELIHDRGLENQIHEDYHDQIEPGMKMFGIQISMGRKCSFDVKHTTGIENLTDLNIKAEIEKVRTECAQALAFLEEVCGAKPEIRWGVIVSHR